MPLFLRQGTGIVFQSVRPLRTIRGSRKQQTLRQTEGERGFAATSIFANSPLRTPTCQLRQRHAHLPQACVVSGYSMESVEYTSVSPQSSTSDAVPLYCRRKGDLNMPTESTLRERLWKYFAVDISPLEAHPFEVHDEQLLLFTRHMHRRPPPFAEQKNVPIRVCCNSHLVNHILCLRLCSICKYMRRNLRAH